MKILGLCTKQKSAHEKAHEKQTLQWKGNTELYLSNAKSISLQPYPCPPSSQETEGWMGVIPEFHRYEYPFPVPLLSCRFFHLSRRPSTLDLCVCVCEVGCVWSFQSWRPYVVHLLPLHLWAFVPPCFLCLGWASCRNWNQSRPV